MFPLMILCGIKRCLNLGSIALIMKQKGSLVKLNVGSIMPKNSPGPRGVNLKNQAIAHEPRTVRT